MNNGIHFICNNQYIETSFGKGITVLDFLRKEKKLTGTKEGCREGDCGACTILVGELNGENVKYKNVNSCLLPLAAVEGKHIVTIEGLNQNNLSLVQQIMANEGGTQCGFCTPGFIVSITGYFLSNHNPVFEDAINFVAGNICRCTGYEAIKRAVNILTEKILLCQNGKQNGSHIKTLTELNFIPNYFITIAERLKALYEKDNIHTIDYNGEFFISGGTDLYVQKWEEIYRAEVNFADEYFIPSGIFIKDGKCFIGASATISGIDSSAVIQKIFPKLKEYLKFFGSMQIRNRATAGGNIINASPIGDFVNILLALNSTLHLAGDASKRDILLKDFYKGYKTLDLNNNEKLEYISFKIPAENSFFNYEKVSRRTYLDIASVNTSIYLEYDAGIINGANISAGGVAPYPLYLKKTSEYLNGKCASKDELKTAIEIAQAEISPISDARGSAGYKALLLRQLLLAHFMKFFPEVISVEDYL